MHKFNFCASYKNMIWIFCKLKKTLKTQKRRIKFASFEKLKKRWISFLQASKNINLFFFCWKFLKIQKTWIRLFASYKISKTWKLIMVLFSAAFLTCTLSARFLIKSVKTDRAVKVHFQVRIKIEDIKKWPKNAFFVR